MKKLFVIAFILIILVSCESKGNIENNALKKNDGETLPLVELANIDGTKLNMGDYSGNVVVLDFWASWCGPCKNSIPFYNSLHDKYAEKGLVIIGVNVNERENVIKKAIEEHGIKYIITMPDEGLTNLFKISGIPTVIIFDRSGDYKEKFVGYSEELDEKIEGVIKDLL